MKKKVIAVVGSTGGQGGGLVKAILADPNGDFAARAVTRKVWGAKVSGLGVTEVAFGDLDDVESLTKAFVGAYGVYGVTNFWEHFSGEKEIQQAKNIAEAAKAAGVEHVIWSTLEDTRKMLTKGDDQHWITPTGGRMPMLPGGYAVAHFDAKAEADVAFADVPTTFLRTSFFWGNAVNFSMGPKSVGDGTYALYFPMGGQKMAGIAVGGVGKSALAIFQAGEEYVGRTIGIAGEFLTGPEMARTYTEELGVTVKYVAMDPDAYRGLGFPGSVDLGNMFQVYRDCETAFLGNRDLELSRRLNPTALDFRGWVRKYKDQLLATMQPATTTA